MKERFYKLYACCFNLCSRLPVRNRAALLSPHMADFSDALGEMEAQMRLRGVRTVRISGRDVRPDRKNAAALWRMLRFFTKGAYDLATAKIVFLNDNFMPLADLRLRREAVWMQLWHAEGAFKRFGLDIGGLDPAVAERVRKGNAKLHAVVCSGAGVADVYASAFGVPRTRVLPLGSPRADRYIRDCRAADTQAFRREYFGGTTKKVILYAPTFRDDPAENAHLLTHFDFARFERELDEEYMLVLRLHPQFSNVEVPAGVCNMTGFDRPGELIAACDLLITDYSSICMDFALLGKPCVFYAFDLDKYADERSFYRDYSSYVPGRVARDFDALLEAVRCTQTDTKALDRFVRFNFDSPDGQAAQRIADEAMRAANLQ